MPDPEMFAQDEEESGSRWWRQAAESRSVRRPRNPDARMTKQRVLGKTARTGNSRPRQTLVLDHVRSSLPHAFAASLDAFASLLYLLACLDTLRSSSLGAQRRPMQQSWRQACLKVFDRHQKLLGQPCWVRGQRRTITSSVVCYALPKGTASSRTTIQMEEFPCEVIRCAKTF